MGRLLTRCGTREGGIRVRTKAVQTGAIIVQATITPCTRTAWPIRATRKLVIIISTCRTSPSMKKIIQQRFAIPSLSLSSLADNGVSSGWWLFFWERLGAVHISVSACVLLDKQWKKKE
jgi:hypothetical protein